MNDLRLSSRLTCVLMVTGCFLMAMGTTGCISGPISIRSNNRHISSEVCSGERRTCEDDCVSAVHVVAGQPNRLIDGAGWVLGIPRKIILWDRRVDNHKVSEQTIAEVTTFAEASNMSDVCVRVNQYAPVDEWKRLTQNDAVSPGWRYTMGTLSVVGYALLPGRLFGRDEYNPYTNSVYVYSDIPALAMEAAAYAKDVQSRQYPGTYAAANSLPLVSIWHETINTDDTLAYIEATGSDDQWQEGLRVLYPNYGASVGGAFDSAFGISPALTIGGAIAGHATSRYRAVQYDCSPSTTPLVEINEHENERSIRLVSERSIQPHDWNRNEFVPACNEP